MRTFSWILICEAKFVFEIVLSQTVHFAFTWLLKWLHMLETILPQTLHSVSGSWQCMCFLRLLLQKLLKLQVLHLNERCFKWTADICLMIESLRMKDLGHKSQNATGLLWFFQCSLNSSRPGYCSPHRSQINRPFLCRMITVEGNEKYYSIDAQERFTRKLTLLAITRSVSRPVLIPPMSLQFPQIWTLLMANFASCRRIVVSLVVAQLEHRFINWSTMTFVEFPVEMLSCVVAARELYFFFLNTLFVY